MENTITLNSKEYEKLLEMAHSGMLKAINKNPNDKLAIHLMSKLCSYAKDFDKPHLIGYDPLLPQAYFYNPDQPDPKMS